MTPLQRGMVVIDEDQGLVTECDADTEQEESGIEVGRAQDCPGQVFGDVVSGDDQEDAVSS